MLVLRFFAISLLLISVGCGGDDDDDSGDGGPDAGSVVDGAVACSEVPAWSAPAFDENAADAVDLRNQLQALTDRMRVAEQDTAMAIDLKGLLALYEAGDPSLSATATAAYGAIVQDALSDFAALNVLPPGDLIDKKGNWAPGKVGGVAGTDLRGINAGGLEVRQIVDKGLFSGGAQYAFALELTAGEITEATIDAIAAAWGANAALDTAESTDAAGYSFEMGFHADMAATLAAAKAHAADDECTEERDAALVSFFRAWELTMLARTIFYGNEARGGLAAATGDDAKIAALHELAEGIGLALGFYGLPHPESGPLAGSGRLLTDANIEGIAAGFGVNLADLSASTTGEFVADVKGLESTVVAVEGLVVEVFEVSQADIESYRTPTEG